MTLLLFSLWYLGCRFKRRTVAAQLAVLLLPHRQGEN